MEHPRATTFSPLSSSSKSSSSSSSSSSFTCRDSSATISSNTGMEPKSLTIRILQEITDNFSDKRALGQGAYGKVYKGVHENGEEIAVKLLHNNMPSTNDEQFQHEFDNLMMLSHPNIIRLVGYCYETQRQHIDYQGRIVFGETTYRALCFEYMHKGSLQGHLTDESHGLDWKTRYKINKGTCEGLKYLHEGLKKPIYHLDLKPDNILLNDDMVPKLADFGLSRLCGKEQTRVTQVAIGTLGYMPPEYLFYRLVSNKVDVFSLGVVITKIIAGPEGPKRIAETSNQEFLDQVHENWRKRLEATCTSSRILDATCEQVSICTEIGLNSMEAERGKRPSIMEIIGRLDETETMVEKAISWSAISRSSMPGKTQKQDEDMVKLEAFTRNKAIQLTETCEEFPILVRVTGSPWHRAEEMPHAGMDVVLAFNPEVAYMNKFMMMLVDGLSRNDRLSILFCGAQLPNIQQVMELTYMSDNGREVARSKIQQLCDFHVHVRFECHGPVLPEAAQILRQRGASESNSRAGCILHVWAGKMSPEIYKQDISQEYRVHTIAVGEYYGRDRDMKYIADLTSGTYKNYRWPNLKEPENIIASSLAYIASAAWRPVRITLQANEGVTISSIASGHYSNLVSSEKQSATVDLDDMYAGEQKTFVIYLTVPRGKEKLVTIGGRYKRLNMSEELVGMDVVVLRPRRKCLPHEVAIHPKVAAELLRIRLKEGIARQTQELSTENLQILFEEIKNSDEGRAAPEEILSELEEEVAKMTNDYEDNMESLLSSLNCLQLQRSTTKGTPPNIGAFQILEQQRVDEQNNLVKIQGFTRSKAIRQVRMCNEFAVMVRVTVAPWHHGWQMPRDGVDIVAVLDISKNMQGEMLELMKQAMMIVIDKLGPDDRLSIVSFPTSKHHLMELTYMSNDYGHGPDAARFKITQLKASTESYMDDAARATLEEGAQILRDRGAEESSSRLGCMIFFSDGKYPEILKIKISPKFPVHTFGLGANHNPEVMKYIADMTSGTYSFVDQGISNIRDALALFITGLTSIAVRSITITLKPQYDVAISSIESGNYIHHVSYTKTSGTIIIDHIYAGEQKDFIVNLIVGNARNKLMTIGGKYKSFKQNISIAEIEMSVLRPRSTSSPDKFAIHPDVAAELMRIQLQNGILHMLKRQKMSTRGMQQLWNMIKHSDEGRGAPKVTVSGLNMDVAKMNRDISGMPYILSWLSCHKWQRATTKGTLNKSSSFRTIGQYADEDTNLVKVKTFTRSNAVPSDDPCNNFPVLVRVMVEPRRHAEEMPRAGVDVVAVLDVSGGMQGKKLERMKEAMMVVIDKLRAEDRLSIVSFNTYENRLTRLTYMTGHGQDVARLKINKLVASGLGNIAAALREGAEILWWREAESSRRVGCIVFLSDCKNNDIFEAEIRPEIPVHTFGLGTDHNPSVMKYIADITSGTYSFVNQDMGMIKDAFSLFITSLTSVAAMSIKITLRTTDGITMSSIESGGYFNQVKDNRFGTIKIDNIYVGEQKDFIVYLRVVEGKKELMTIGGQYLSHDTVKHLVYKDVYVQRPQKDCLPDDLAIQPEVAAELVRIRLEKGISTMLEKGLSTVGLQQLWEEIMGTDEGRGAPAETMSGLIKDITEMKRDIENPKEYRKSGLPYTLSWLTSRKWQRATTKGTPCSSGAFHTTGKDADGRETLL